MSIQSDFKTFLSDIEPSRSTVEMVSSAQNALRSYLVSHGSYSGHCLKTYLSGSYAKSTAIRPVKDEDNRDVDIVVETDHSALDNSADVIIELRDALLDSQAYSSAKLQTHSVGLELSKLAVDVVPLATDSGSCWIGCINDGTWSPTNPAGHIKWSTEMNKSFDGRYKPIVKIMKWWRRENCPGAERWPKGITLEKIIADCFPRDEKQYADIVIALMENIGEAYGSSVSNGVVPVIEDPATRGNDLAASYTVSSFQSFLNGLQTSFDVLQESGPSNELWRRVLGNRFPKSETEQTKALGPSFSSPEVALSVQHRQKVPWSMASKKASVHIVADVKYPDGHTERISNNGRMLPKHCEIDYRAIRSSSTHSYAVKWQIVNTGEEARAAECLRGEFEASDPSNGIRHESTAYVGRHYVQCFVIHNGVCIAHSKEFFINVADV